MKKTGQQEVDRDLRRHVYFSTTTAEEAWHTVQSVQTVAGNIAESPKASYSLSTMIIKPKGADTESDSEIDPNYGSSRRKVVGMKP